MSGECPRCFTRLNPFKDCNEIPDHGVHLWRCPNCLNEYIE